MEDFKSKVLSRDLNPYHSFLASFFAGLAEMGLLNQGSVNIIGKRAAEYLHFYLEAKEILPNSQDYKTKSDLEQIQYTIAYINDILSLLGGYQVTMGDDGKISLLIEGSLCRICPKAVGGAEVKGTVCPVPSFMEKLVNLILNEEKIKLVTRGIEKEGSTCKAEYQVK